MLVGVSVFTLGLCLAVPSVGLNLLPEVLAIWFALFVIDEALAESEAARLKPVRVAIATEAVRIHNQLVHSINWALAHSATPDDRAALLLAAEHGVGLPRLSAIAARADFNDYSQANPADGLAASLHTFTVMAIYEAEVAQLQGMIDRFMTRYVTVAEADLVGAIQSVERTSFVSAARQAERLPLLDDLMREVVWSSAIFAEMRVREAIVTTAAAWGLADDRVVRLTAIGDLKHFERVPPDLQKGRRRPS